MNKRVLENEDLDKLGDRLLRAGKLRPDELEEIVSAPFLFSAVKRQISQGSERGTAGWCRGQFSAWRSGILAGAAAAFLISIAGIVVFVMQQEQSQTDISVKEQRVTQDGPSTSVPGPAPVDSTPVAKKDERPLVPVHASYVSERKPAAATRVRDRQRAAAYSEPGDFKPVLYAGLPEQVDGNAQIVRVDLPPRALHAIGVNVQVENEVEKIKTDLLLGPDGSVKGFRLVGKY